MAAAQSQKTIPKRGNGASRTASSNSIIVMEHALASILLAWHFRQAQ